MRQTEEAQRQAQEGNIVVIDPETGEQRLANAEEAAALGYGPSL